MFSEKAQVPVPWLESNCGSSFDELNVFSRFLLSYFKQNIFLMVSSLLHKAYCLCLIGNFITASMKDRNFLDSIISFDALCKNSQKIAKSDEKIDIQF